MLDPGLSVIPAWDGGPPPTRARLVRKNSAAKTAPLMTKRPKSFFTKSSKTFSDSAALILRGEKNHQARRDKRDPTRMVVMTALHHAAGLNFGSVTPSPVSSNTTSTGIPIRTFSIGQPMTLLQKRGPSSKSTHAVT